MNYLIQKLITSFFVCLAVITFTFFLIHLIPGDPIEGLLPPQATIEEKNNLKSELGLDKPLSTQYALYMKGVFSGNWGRSLVSKKPVLKEIFYNFKATAQIALSSFILTCLVGIFLGVLTALKQNTFFDSSVGFITMILLAIPGFCLGPLLIWLISVKLLLLPISGQGSLAHLILPTVSLSAGLIAILIHVTRSSFIDVMNQPFVRTARSKGLPEYKIHFKHTLKNALLPIITVLGLQMGALLTGTVLIENIFDWEGLGTLLLSSIKNRDYPLAQGCILFVSVIYVFIHFCTDLVYSFVSPQIRF